MTTYRFALMVGVALTCCGVFSGARSALPPPNLPPAIFTDPVDDSAHPASGQGIQFRRRRAPGALEPRYGFSDTDHGFNSRRIALQESVLRWLAELPGAPP